MPLGSLYTTIDRMEQKGFVTSRLGAAGQERGGNRRKYFKLTGMGRQALQEYERSIRSVRQFFPGLSVPILTRTGELA